MYNPTRSDGEESYIQSYFESIYEDNLEQLFETINLKKESKKELSEEEPAPADDGGNVPRLRVALRPEQGLSYGVLTPRSRGLQYAGTDAY